MNDWSGFLNLPPATALAILLASAVALFALRLLIVGVPLTVVAEVPEGTQQLSGVVNAKQKTLPLKGN
jgi:hypothetical protein